MKYVITFLEKNKTLTTNFISLTEREISKIYPKVFRSKQHKFSFKAETILIALLLLQISLIKFHL